VRNRSAGNGKVVVNRAMSLDGFIAGPGDAQDWIFDFMANDAPWQKETAAATGAMLVGRRTVEVGERMEANHDRGTESRGEGYPFHGPVFVLTHRPPDPPDPEVTYLTGDIGEAVATALGAAGGKDLQILGAGGSSTRFWSSSCRCCSATASGSIPPRASPGSTWNRSTARGRAPSPSSGTASANKARRDRGRVLRMRRPVCDPWVWVARPRWTLAFKTTWGEGPR